jgi:hypothetical protein
MMGKVRDFSHGNQYLSDGEWDGKEVFRPGLEKVLYVFFNGPPSVQYDVVFRASQLSLGPFGCKKATCLESPRSLSTHFWAPATYEGMLVLLHYCLRTCFENSYGSSKGATGCLSARVSGGLSSALADKQPVAPFSKHVLRTRKETTSLFQRGSVGASRSTPRRIAK